VAKAFRAAAEAARNAPSDDAGEQLAIAAKQMRKSGKGKATQFYADGLDQAASEFRGRQGISMDSLLPFLQSFLGGVQRNNPAQPGQGTMIDALLPAVSDFMQAKQQGLDTTEAAMRALGSAVTGARSTGARSGSSTRVWEEGGGMSAPQIDPGAASATNVLGGIVGALLPGVLGALSQGGLGGQTPTSAGRGVPIGDQPTDPMGGMGGLGDIIGALGSDYLQGRQGSQRDQPSQGGGWWPF
jgi:hypothetical protein